MPLAACGVTHQGRRSSNEDAWLVDLDAGLLLVADGMGGHNAGEVASALAVEAIQTVVTSGQAPGADVLAQAVRTANDRILDAADELPERSGMGTTVVVVLVDGDTAYYSSVGDSRLYLWRGGRLTQLTRDDSWVSETFGQGADTPPGNAAMHPMRHVLTKVVGLRTDLELTVAAHLLASGDGLLLCSDGVHGSISDERLAEVMGSGRPVAEIAAAVVEAALDGGATDNITAVVARYD